MGSECPTEGGGEKAEVGFIGNRFIAFIASGFICVAARVVLPAANDCQQPRSRDASTPDSQGNSAGLLPSPRAATGGDRATRGDATQPPRKDIFPFTAILVSGSILSVMRPPIVRPPIEATRHDRQNEVRHRAQPWPYGTPLTTTPLGASSTTDLSPCVSSTAAPETWFLWRLTTPTTSSSRTTSLLSRPPMLSRTTRAARGHGARRRHRRPENRDIHECLIVRSRVGRENRRRSPSPASRGVVRVGHDFSAEFLMAMPGVPRPTRLWLEPVRQCSTN